MLPHASVVESDNSEGRTLPLLWETFSGSAFLIEVTLLESRNLARKPMSVGIQLELLSENSRIILCYFTSNTW